MRSTCLMLSRFAVSAWIGAACLFVVTSVQEQRSEQIESILRSHLALLRFPTYYRFGFVLVAFALLTGVVAKGHAAAGKWQFRIYLGLLIAALGTMIADYIWIYQPLAEMTRNVDAARPADFHNYHVASMYVNTVQIGMCLLAALVVNWSRAAALPSRD